MDSITHIVLGGVLGEVMLGKKAGRRVLAYGAFAQCLPDIDTIASLWLTPSANLLAHRGITHSVFFVVTAGLTLAWLAYQKHKQEMIPLSQWILFFGFQLLVHLAIDSFNAYGVGWLEPFADRRIGFNILYVVDPFYTLALAIGFFLLVNKSDQNKRYKIALISLAISVSYLAYAIGNKLATQKRIADLLPAYDLSEHTFFTTPAPFNTWLWFVVVEDTSGYRIGYRSVFDDPTLHLTYVKKNSELLRRVKDKESLSHLLNFSHGCYTVSQQHDTLVFNIPRFGQITGWHNPSLPFVFHYYLDYNESNRLVMQRGRFDNWNNETIATFIHRMGGQ